MTIFAPCQAVNALPVPLQLQVRQQGGGTGSSVSSSSLTAKGAGDSSGASIVEDHTLAPAQVVGIHTGASYKPEVSVCVCVPHHHHDCHGTSFLCPTCARP